MSLHQILFNNFILFIFLIIIGSCLAFEIPPVIPSSVILDNRYLLIYGSSVTNSSDAQFLNAYDLDKRSINDLTTFSREKIGNIDGYSPSLIPLKNDAKVGVLEYGLMQGLIKGEISAENFLLPIDNSYKKLGTTFQGSMFSNSTVPELFPQQGYSVVRVDLPENSVYYFIGGIVYSKKLNKGAISRVFWSYTVDKYGNGKWDNLSKSTTNKGNENFPHMAYHSCTTASNLIYCVGGMQTPDNSTSVLYEVEGANIPSGPNTSLKTVHVFDIGGGTWSTITVYSGEECLGFNVIGHSLIYYSNSLYLIGGVSKLGGNGDGSQDFVQSCKFYTGNPSWSPVDFKVNGKDIKLSTAFQTIQQISPTYFIAGYGYRDTGSSLGPLIGISITQGNYTLDNTIPPPSPSKDEDPSGPPPQKDSSTHIYIIISVTVGVTAVVFGIIGFLLYRYKLKNNINQVDSDKRNSNSQLRGNGTLFNSVPKHHRATLWSDSITGGLAKPSKAHYRHNGSNEMLIPLSETGDTNLEYGHFDHFQHQPTISSDSIDLSPMVSANQLPQFDIGKTSASPSFTSLNYLTRSNSDLRTTSSSATLGDEHTNLTKTKF